MNWQSLLSSAMSGDTRSIARCISLVEDEGPGYDDMLRSLSGTDRQNIIGITGPPGAGKSTLTDGLIGAFVRQGKRVAVLCVDPSSPFNLGALLGDRIRMSEWYTHPDVFIRSLATRGSLGGLHPRILEIADLLKALPFDIIIIETVGVGQSEIEIAGLADCTVVVLVPEAGDEVQTMKAGLMEIADVFVINKSDRPDADHFMRYLQAMVHASGRETPVIRTVATEKKGLDDVAKAVEQYLASPAGHERRYWLLAERAYNLMRNRRMKDISKQTLKKKIEDAVNKKDFNLYMFIEDYLYGK